MPIQKHMPSRFLMPGIAALALCVGSLALCPAGPAQGGAAQKPQDASASEGGSYSGISIQTSEQLFATLCALDAAGFGENESTLAAMPQSIALRADLLQMQGPAVEAVRAFYRDHVLGDPGETLSRFVSFALVAGPPPAFNYTLGIDYLPPDAVALDGFQKVLGDFYREAHLDRRWTKVQPEYEQVIAQDDPAIRRIVITSNGYLREIVRPSNGRTFTVYVEPLVGGRVNFRNFGDHYAVVVGGSNLPAGEIRHAYLHFLLDPLPLRYRDDVQRKAALLNIAARAPRLPSEYQNDFVDLMDECLIKAVELRLRHLPADQLEAALKDDDEAGYILVRPLVAQLEIFEKEAPAMTYYFPDLIAGISVPEEQKRLATVKFTPAGAAPAKADAESAAANPQAQIEGLLTEGNRALASRNAVAAREAFGKALQQDPNDARALYGMAIASVLGGDADRAKSLFESLVSGPRKPGQDAGAPDPSELSILAWSHVYLGRIHDLEGERELAVNEYHAALGVEGAPEAARVAAQDGIAKAYAPPAGASHNGTQNP
ncbi:MAG TPA: tetratricopeptide repeat protein [Candidatus Acidoferrales bacterium]|nr:tetratricopeptide repeat protein [Candidatus Acidoferrales bacterium]